MTGARFSACLAGIAATALIGAGAADAGASDRASCNGIGASSGADQPGLVSAAVHQIHQDLKDAGIPPGAGDSSFAKLHEGSLEGCLGL